jgi:hypothetical protein
MAGKENSMKRKLFGVTGAFAVLLALITLSGCDDKAAEPGSSKGSAILLVDNEEKEGTINADQEVWYKFVMGTDNYYRVYWQAVSPAAITVTGYESDGETILSGFNALGGSTYHDIYRSVYDGTVYIKVRGRTAGTYKIKYD